MSPKVVCGVEQRVLEERAQRCFRQLKADDFEPLSRLINMRLDRLYDTLKKSNDINMIRFVQGQISAFEWFINSVDNS